MPEPAQLTVMPREAAQREKICPTGWMPSGKETCARSPRAGAGAVEGAREGLEADFDVAKAARVEQRLAGDAARAPVLGDAVVLRDAELAVELRVRQRAQRVLVEDRDLAPDLRVVELRQVEPRQSLLPERRAQRPLDRAALALALEAADRIARLRQGGRHRRFCRKLRAAVPTNG